MTSLPSPLQLLRHREAAASASQPLALLKQLPRRAQQVFLLSRVDDLPYTAIAQRLNTELDELQDDMVRVLEQTRPNGRPALEVQQASRWYVRLQSPQTTPSDRIDFRRWLDAAPAHLAAFHETELHWRRLLLPAQELAAGGAYQQKHRSLEIGAWLAGLLSMVLLMVLAL